MLSELLGNMVIIRDKRGVKLHEKSHYGNLIDQGLQLSLIEALFLVGRGKIKISENGKMLTEDEMLQIIHKNDLFIKYMVFSDLRNRGYVLKTGFKYGSEFRLYERGKSPGDGHSDYLVKVVSENHKIPASDFSGYIRVAHGVNKKLLLAVVDEENDITYYSVKWMKP